MREGGQPLSSGDCAHGITCIRIGIPFSLLAGTTEGKAPRAVADARDQGYSWAEIADLLGVTAPQGHAGRTDQSRTPFEDRPARARVGRRRIPLARRAGPAVDGQAEHLPDKTTYSANKC
jgi:hypothetical protein